MHASVSVPQSGAPPGARSQAVVCCSPLFGLAGLLGPSGSPKHHVGRHCIPRQPEGGHREQPPLAAARLRGGRLAARPAEPDHHNTRRSEREWNPRCVPSAGLGAAAGIPESMAHSRSAACCPHPARAAMTFCSCDLMDRWLRSCRLAASSTTLQPGEEWERRGGSKHACSQSRGEARCVLLPPPRC